MNVIVSINVLIIYIRILCRNLEHNYKYKEIKKYSTAEIQYSISNNQ